MRLSSSGTMGVWEVGGTLFRGVLVDVGERKVGVKRI